MTSTPPPLEPRALRPRALGPLTIQCSGDPATLAYAEALLQHLPESPGSGPMLRVELAALATPIARGAGRARGGTPSFHQGEIQTFVVGRDVVVQDDEAELVVHAGGTHITGGVPRASFREPSFFAERTLFAALLVALRHHGLYHLHAGAVLLDGDPGELALVVGSGGAGKSTTTLALLEGGARFLGDDAVLLTGTKAQVETVAFPKAFHAGARTLAAFPRLEAIAGPPYRRFSDKRAFDPARAFPGRFAPGAGAPRYLLFPIVSGDAESGVAALDAGEAHYRLLESSALVLAEGMAGRREHLELLTACVAGARSFAVTLGADALRDPRAFAERLVVALRSEQG